MTGPWLATTGGPLKTMIVQTAILVHGPTASGKTSLSVALAKRLGGEVVNADSMQVYQDLRVISARPSEEEMDGVPHHLFGHVDASERYSTGRWLRQASETINGRRRFMRRSTPPAANPAVPA